jgi:Skp family chaperone for outer membrane proteins
MHETLIAKHNERWNEVGDTEDNLHILTFDIIYCSIVYGFYAYKDYTKIIKRSKADLAQQKLEDEIEVKREELETLETELEREQESLESIPEIFMENQIVRHKMFGTGKVIKQNGSYIEVEFASRTSKFVITMAFVNGFLSSEDITILERCKKLETAIAVCSKIEKTIKTKQTELDFLIAKLMKQTKNTGQ